MVPSIFDKNIPSLLANNQSLKSKKCIYVFLSVFLSVTCLKEGQAINQNFRSIIIKYISYYYTCVCSTKFPFCPTTVLSKQFPFLRHFIETKSNCCYQSIVTCPVKHCKRTPLSWRFSRINKISTWRRRDNGLVYNLALLCYVFLCSICGCYIHNINNKRHRFLWFDDFVLL